MELLFRDNELKGKKRQLNYEEGTADVTGARGECFYMPLIKS
jgi:hypothetical protein